MGDRLNGTVELIGLDLVCFGKIDEHKSAPCAHLYYNQCIIALIDNNHLLDMTHNIIFALFFFNFLLINPLNDFLCTTNNTCFTLYFLSIHQIVYKFLDYLLSLLVLITID